MNTTGKTTNKSKKPTAAQIAKRKAQMDRLDAQIAKRNIKNHEALAFGIAGLVAQNPRIEWEIVHNYMTRNNRVMVDQDKHDAEMRRLYPEYDRLCRADEQRKARKAKRQARKAG